MSTTNRPGMMLLTTVLLMGAVALMIALSVANRGIGELSTSFNENQGIRAYDLAEGCAQNSLLRLSQNPAYTGETLSLNEGDCVISVQSNGNDRTVSVSATVQAWTHHLILQLTISGTSITINEWNHSAA